MVKKIMAALLAVCLLFSTLPSAMFAGTGDEGTSRSFDMKITNITAPTEVYQGEAKAYVVINFEISGTEIGDAFVAGQQYSVDTNIGELFTADWTTLNHLAVTDSTGVELGYISITEDTVTFTVSEGGAGGESISGSVTTTGTLTANDVGATQGNDIERQLTVGTATADITFKWKEATPPSSSGEIGTVDINTQWKNAWAIENNTGAVVQIEVNPIGSMDLYGSTTYKGSSDHSVKIHDQFFVIDEIPAHGFVDTTSLQIYAAVPTIAQLDEDKIFNNGYDVPKGGYYAQRSGTQRYFLNRDDHGHNCMKELKQEPNETIEEFETRMRLEENALHWGIYRQEDSNGNIAETFMCNFGRIGDPDKNNGIYYKDFPGQSSDYAKKYPSIFGDEGASGGNIVSYYIEFNTYYPDVIGAQELVNHATWSATNEAGWGNNSAPYLINNGGGTGVVRANDLVVVLLDEDSREPIANVTFDVQEKNGDDWTTQKTCTTDENGRFSLKNFPEGTYRVVQTSFADGYEEVSTFTDSGNDKVNALDKDGVFTVQDTDAFGYGTVVTNKKTDTTTVAYKFVNGTEGVSGTEIPDEVMAYLPTDTESYEVGETVKAKAPAETTVIGPKSDSDNTAGVWTFKGYDQNSVEVTDENVEEGITFTGTWTWKQADAIEVEPADITIYMGGDAGFEGAVNDEGTIVSDGSLPEPGFRVTLPQELAEKDLTSLSFKDSSNNTKEWKFESYDGTSSEIFKLEPIGSNKEKTRMQFKQADGTIVTSDQFDVSKAINQTLTMSLYKGEGNTAVGDVVVTDDDGLIYYVYSSATAELTVRGTTSTAKYADVQSTDAAIDKGEPGLVAADDTVYTINEGNVQAEKAGIALLFDEIIDTNDDDRLELLRDRADKELANSRGTRHYDIKYLDLVDRDNGNAWVKANKPVTVYWPLPEGTNKNTDFTLLHFEDLHREMDINDVADEIKKCTVSGVSIKEVTDTHVIFEIGSGGFSPFALVWDEKNDHPHWPPVGPGDDDDDPSEDPEEPDTPALDKVNHFLYVEGYPEDYRTGEYSDNEDLWPVKPQGNITRAEVATIFYRLLKDEVREEIETDVNSFPDVNEDDWFNVTVSSLANMGAISGYEDGTFRPNEPISRAELAAMAVRFYDAFEAEYEEGTFLDVDGDEWYADAIAAAEELGIIGGYPDGTVRPNNNITRAETCAIVNRVLERRPHDDHLGDVEDMRTWPDNQPGAWYYADMQEATNGHYYEWIDIDGSKFEEWTEVDKDYDWTKR